MIILAGFGFTAYKIATGAELGRSLIVATIFVLFVSLYAIITLGKPRHYYIEGDYVYYRPFKTNLKNIEGFEVDEEPREVLRAIPGVELVEMLRNRENSLCCGDGGGNIVRDVEFRPSLKRIDEAGIVAADVIAVACPFCLMMLEDAVKVKKADVKVADVVELLYESVFGVEE